MSNQKKKKKKDEKKNPLDDVPPYLRFHFINWKFKPSSTLISFRFIEIISDKLIIDLNA